MRQVVAVVATLLACHGPTLAQGSPPSRELAEAAAAYAAKVAASALFVSGRSLDSVLAEELAPTRPLERLIRPLLRFTVDQERGEVRCQLGAVTATAVRTGNLGCTLLRAEASKDSLRARVAAPGPSLAADRDTMPWPLGEGVPAAPATDIDHAALAATLELAFAEPAERAIHTRAIVVVHRGRLVAERYAAGYRANMPLPGWSMSKTWTHALLGVRVQQGKLDLAATLPVPEWAAQGDRRQTLRAHDLLTMTAGLQWNEDYDDPRSDALRMLFGSGDHAAVFATQPIVTPPGQAFVYSSGATNLLCRVLRTTFADDREYWAFPREHLFARLGMHTAVLETDPSGTFVGSSYGFASARDWARFGMLYADDGRFAGEQVLPPGWVATARVASAASLGRYGHHVWLDADPDGDGPRQREWPELPDDLLRMDGHEGQAVVVSPQHQLVVVRLGCTKNGGFDLRGLVRGALAAVQPATPVAPSHR
jgi:CubicO group peptidase (beta-lactamase class C family)